MGRVTRRHRGRSGGHRGLDLDAHKSIRKRRTRLEVVKDVVEQFVKGRPADQIGSLTQALKLLQPLANDQQLDDVVWKARIDRIESYRLRGDLERASQLIAEANNETVPTEYMGRLAAEMR